MRLDRSLNFLVMVTYLYLPLYFYGKEQVIVIINI